MPPRPNPYPSFNFLVEIDGLAAASFVECSGLASQTRVIEYREGGDVSLGVRKLPGLTAYANLVLRRGFTASRDLWQWRRLVETGQTERRSGAIVLLDEARQPVARWIFRNGWPVRWDGPHFRATSKRIAIETLEIAHEGLELAD